jgi:hypothetical protein
MTPKLNPYILVRHANKAIVRLAYQKARTFTLSRERILPRSESEGRSSLGSVNSLRSYMQTMAKEEREEKTDMLNRSGH